MGVALLLGFGFPNPITWTVDRVKDFAGDVAENSFEAIIGGLTAWVVDALVWIVGGIFDFFFDTADPNLQAAWFSGRDGPYAMTATVGATLLVGFVLAGITQGVLAGDIGGMLRRIAFDLPVSVLGMVGLVAVTQALIRLVDVLSNGVLESFSEDVAAFTHAVTSLSSLAGGVGTAFVIFLLGLVAVLAGIVLVAELVIRAALIYVVVALAPLVFAARLWPSLAAGSRKLLELLTALVVSKLVIAVALAVAAAAAAGVGSGGEVVEALPAPEVFAEDPGGSVTNAVGLLLAAIAAFGVAAFSPLLVARLFPLAEAALVAQGVRGGPMRAGQQAMTLQSYGRSVRGSADRSSQVATAPLPPAPAGAGTAGPTAGGAGAGGGAASTGSGGGAAAAGGAASAGATVAAGAASKAAKTGATTMTDRTTGDAAGEGGAAGERSSAPRGGGGWRSRVTDPGDAPIGPSPRRSEDPDDTAAATRDFDTPREGRSDGS